jgi:hypothetical protein
MPFSPSTAAREDALAAADGRLRPLTAALRHGVGQGASRPRQLAAPHYIPINKDHHGHPATPVQTPLPYCQRRPRNSPAIRRGTRSRPTHIRPLPAHLRNLAPTSRIHNRRKSTGRSLPRTPPHRTCPRTPGKRPAPTPDGQTPLLTPSGSARAVATTRTLTALNSACRQCVARAPGAPLAIDVLTRAMVSLRSVTWPLRARGVRYDYRRASIGLTPP